MIDSDKIPMKTQITKKIVFSKENSGARNLSVFQNCDISFQDVKDLLENKNYSPSQMYFAMGFLEKNKLFKHFKLNNTEEKTYRRMLMNLLKHIELKVFEEGKVIHNEGEINTNFYLIFQGTIITKNYELDMIRLSPEEYFDQLTKLKNEGNNLIINKIINENKDIYPIFNSGDITDFKEIILKQKLKEKLKKFQNINTIRNLFKKYIEKPSIEITTILEESDESGLINVLFKVRNYVNNDKRIEFYNYFKSKEKKNLKFYKIKENQILQENDYFGSQNFDKQSQISDNIFVVSSESCVLGSITTQNYLDIFSKEIDKINLHFNNFLSHFNFFSKIKDIFNYFTFSFSEQGKIVVNEQENISHFYFIKEGEIEISLNIKIKEMKELIKKIEKKMNIHIDDENSESEFEEYYRNRFASKENQEEKKIQMKFMIYGKNQILGSELILFTKTYPYQAKVCSKSIKFFKIPVENLLELLSKDEKSMEIFDEYLGKNMAILLKRMKELLIVYDKGNKNTSKSERNKKNLIRKKIITLDKTSNKINNELMKNFNFEAFFPKSNTPTKPLNITNKFDIQSRNSSHFEPKTYDQSRIYNPSKNDNSLSQQNCSLPFICKHDSSFVSRIAYANHLTNETKEQIRKKIQGKLKKIRLSKHKHNF